MSLLRSSSGATVYVVRGSSAVVTATFSDATGVDLAVASIESLKATLTNAEDGSVINGRARTSILNANGGSLSQVDGAAVLTLKLQPEDNCMCGSSSPGMTEIHKLVLEWKWNDGDGTPMTGMAQFDIQVVESRW